MTPAFNGMLFDRSLICASCGAAVAAVIVAALALVVGRFVRRRPAPLRYGLLLAALVVLGIVPAVAAASRLGGWAALHISPSAVDRPLAARPFIARPEMPRPSPSPSPALSPSLSPSPVVAADDDFVPPEQIHRIEKTVAAPLRMPTLREAASGLLWAWLGGLLFFVGMVIRDLVRLRLLRQTLVPCTSPAAVGLLDEASRSVGLTQPPRLFESAAVPVPVVIGPVKPVVVLPAGMANTLDHEKLTAVLLHEAAHVVHGDLWVGLLQHAVAAIFWWCPPVHRLNRRLAEVREEICDDYVVLAQGDGFQLAEVLVEMAAGLRGSRQRLTIGTLGAIDEKPALEGRVERLIDLTRKAAPMTRMNRLAVVSAGAFGLVALAIVLATTIHAADEPPAAEPKASAPPLGSTEAEEPSGQTAALSRRSEQANGKSAGQPEIGPDKVSPFAIPGTVVRVAADKYGAWSVTVSDGTRVSVARAIVESLKESGRQCETLSVRPLQRLGLTQPQSSKWPSLAIALEEGGNHASIALSEEIELEFDVVAVVAEAIREVGYDDVVFVSEPKALALPLSATKANEPQAEAAGPSRETEYADGKTLAQPGIDADQVASFALTGTVVRVMEDEYGAWSVSVSDETRVRVARAIVESLTNSGRQCDTVSVRPLQRTASTQPQNSNSPGLAVILEEGGNRAYIWPSEGLEFDVVSSVSEAIREVGYRDVIFVSELKRGLYPSPVSTAAAPSREPEQAVGQAAPLILTGVVVDKAGKPVPGAVVTARNHEATIQIEATAGDQGAFTLKLPMPPRAGASLIVSAADSDRSLLGFHRFPLQQPQLPGSDKYRIAIEPTRSAKVIVIDGEGKPVEGAQVRMQLDWPVSIGPSETDASGVATFQVPQSETIMSVIALKDHQGLDYEVYSLPQAQQGDQFAQRPEFPFAAGQTLILDGASPLAIRAEDAQGNPLPDVNSRVWVLRKEDRHDQMNLAFYIGLDQMTDASGSLTFAWFPKWQTEPVTIWSDATGYAHQRTDHFLNARSETVTVPMQRLVPLRGSVKLPDGKPAANITLSAHGAGYSVEGFHASGRTDESGRYEILVAPNQTYMLAIADEQWAAPAQSGFVVLPEQEVPEHDFTLRPATRIHGRVLDRSTSQPVAGQLLYLNQDGISLNEIGKDLLPNPSKLNVWVCPTWQQNKTSGSDGGFEFFVAEGEYNLSTIFQTGERIIITEESEKEIDLRIDVEAPKVLTGIVTQGDAKIPVSDVLIHLYPTHMTSYFEKKAMSTADGRFAFETKAGPAYAFVLDKKAGLGAVAEVGAEQTSVDLPLLKLGSASGRLLTEDGSQAAGGVKLIYAVRIKDPIDKTSLLRFGGEVTTDADGTFTLPYLVPGWDYDCDCNDYPGGMMLGVAKVNVQPGESKSLGDRKKPTAPKHYVPPTLEERTLAAFRATKTPLERLEKAKKRIQDVHNNLLVVWGNPDDERVKDLMRIRFEDEAFQRYHNDYSFMYVSTATDSLEAARELATALDMPLAPSETELLLAVLDKNGEVVARLASADFCAGGSIAKDLFFAELDRHKPTPLDAHELLKLALATAQRENKRVMLLETAAWCGPCQILSGWLQRNQQWEKDYVWVKIDQRWTGATEIMKELRGEDRSIPWVGILDAAGKPLATSDNPASGSNIGNPTTSPELDHFRHMFESTCQRMTPEEITELMKAAVVEVGR